MGKWETFCDKSYFDTQAVRRKDDKDFNSPYIFHLLNEKETERLCELLNELDK